LYENLTSNRPFGIDLDKKTSSLYLATCDQIIILNLKLEVLSSWKYSHLAGLTSRFRGLKIHERILYLTIEGWRQIFLYKPEDGTLLNRWGGEFNYPLGITVNNKFVYVCDSWNHRIQILTKKGGFSSQWGKKKSETDLGQFVFPRIIYRDLSEDTFYVGDQHSVHLLNRDGKWIQRLGEKSQGSKLSGICVMEDQLYISDDNNKRIQIFRRKS